MLSISRIYSYINIVGFNGFLKLLFSRLTGKKFIIDLKIPGKNKNVKLRIPSSDPWVFKQVFLDKEYDFKTINSPKFIVDAGANIGLASVFFAELFPDAKIIAIEPEKSNFILLKKNVADYPNIIPLQAALWNHNTKINICDSGLGEWGFMTQEISDNTQKIEHAVDALTVDEIIKKFNLEKINILKIDIEGAEKEVFQNTECWINNVDALIVELHDRMKSGCSRNFYQNSSGFSEEWIKGENIYLSKGNIKEI